MEAAGTTVERAHQPMVWICAACLAGVVCDRVISPPAAVWLLAALVGIAVWLSVFRHAAGLRGAGIVLFVWCATAALYHHGRWHWFASDDVGFHANEAPQPVCIIAMAETAPRIRRAPSPDPLCTLPQQDKWEVLVDVQQLRDGRVWRNASGHVWLTVTGHPLAILPGTRL